MIGVSRNDEGACGTAQLLCENSLDCGYGSDDGAFHFFLFQLLMISELFVNLKAVHYKLL
jgi:hypothetical protein